MKTSNKPMRAPAIAAMNFPMDVKRGFGNCELGRAGEIDVNNGGY